MGGAQTVITLHFSPIEISISLIFCKVIDRDCRKKVWHGPLSLVPVRAMAISTFESPCDRRTSTTGLTRRVIMILSIFFKILHTRELECFSFSFHWIIYVMCVKLIDCISTFRLSFVLQNWQHPKKTKNWCFKYGLSKKYH